MTSMWCERALVGDRVRSGVLIDVEDGRFTSIEIGADPSAEIRLHGLTLPGLANAHSHAFHRALRSRTQAHRGTFWTWRELMYRAAENLQPDGYYRLARAVFGEMVMAGITCVGEFHYLHHQDGGTPYADPNEMGRVLLAAASEAGLRISLLDTLYLHGGLNEYGHTAPLAGQRRFADHTVDQWASRVSQVTLGAGQRIGAAIHSVRAVDVDAISTIAAWAAAANAPIHAHVSEQMAENDACLAHYDKTPIGLLSEAGAVSANFSAVHATHLAEADIALLADAGATVVMCPTTERDLGDGIGPTAEFRDHDLRMAVGSDSHAMIDLFEEVRAVELDERLRSQSRGIHTAEDLLSMATVNGHRSLGWGDAGEISTGMRADLVTVALDSVRLAGTSPDNMIEASVFAAAASDVTHVYVDGEARVAHGRHLSIDVPDELDTAVKDLMHSE